jgi:hypothetical protein
MSKQQVRHLVASARGSVVAAAAFERLVEVWDVRQPALLGAATTVMDFGGKRLGIWTDPLQLVAAAYEVHGVVGYDASGRPIWTRRDVQNAQHVRSALHARAVYVACEEAPCELLDVATGRTLARIRDVRDVIESRFQPLCLLARDELELASVPALEPFARIPRETFALLCAAFSPDAVLISESGGPVRCVAINGTERWRWRPAKGAHVVDACFSAAANAFFGVLMSYANGGPLRLARFEPDTGKELVLAELGDAETTCFCADDQLLLTSNGGVIDLQSGQSRPTVSLGSSWLSG